MYSSLVVFGKGVNLERGMKPSYDQYVISAIKFNPLNYILKPVELESLQETIKLAVDKIAQRKLSTSQIVNLLYSLENDTGEKQMAVDISDKVKIVNVSDVLYIEANGRYCKFSPKPTNGS